MLTHVSVGEGYPVILLHGWGASSLIFEQMIIPKARDLGSGYKFIAIDLPGHGKNGTKKLPKWIKRKEVIPFIVNEVMDTVDELGIDKFAIVGYSFGATIAQEIAAKHMSRAEALVINDSIYDGHDFETDNRRWSFRLLYNLLRPIGETRFILKLVNNKILDRIARFIRKKYFAHTRSKDPDLNRQIDEIKAYDKRNTNPTFWAAGVDALFSYYGADAIYRIRCPVLLISGNDNPVKATRTTKRIADIFAARGRKNVEVQEIVNSGHHIVLLNSDSFTERFLEFLDKHIK